jgi:type IV pilus assembly protein PilP
MIMYKKWVYKILFLSMALLGINICCYAQESVKGGIANHEQKIADNQYSYKYEGRLDPFKPFVAPKTSMIAQDPNEIVDEAAEYTGMQLFEPGQLNLVGVMLSSQSPFALVEDQTKKGYILKLGDLLGKRGVITSIDSQGVVVTEIAKTRAGKELKSTITMRIKKEGDK